MGFRDLRRANDGPGLSVLRWLLILRRTSRQLTNVLALSICRRLVRVSHEMSEVIKDHPPALSGDNMPLMIRRYHHWGPEIRKRIAVCVVFGIYETTLL